MTKHYDAPWSSLLIVVSSLVTLVCISVAVVVSWKVRGALAWMAVLPLAIVVGSALFTIRGYTLHASRLTRFP